MVVSEIKSIAKGLKSVLSGMKVGSGWGIILEIADGMKGLMQMVGVLLKLITNLMSPIANVIMGLLYPILLILKPLTIGLQRIMQPFFELGLEAMRQGAELMVDGDLAGATEMFAAGAAILLGGLGTVIAASMYTTVTTFASLILELMLLIAGTIIPISEEKKDEIMEEAQLMWGTMFGSFLSMGVDQIAGLANLVGLDTAVFEKDAKEGIFNFLLGEDGVEKLLTDETLNYTEIQEVAIKDMLGTGSVGLTSTTQTLADDLGKAGVSKVNQILAEAREKAAAIVAAANSRAESITSLGGLL
jgi:hypothetical protein